MENLKKLNKYLLPQQLCLEYFKNILEDVNYMSVLALNLLESQAGCFFTLLPSDANFEQLYQFKPGGILPQFPEEEMIIDGCRSTFCWIPNIRDEIAQLIFNEMKDRDNFSIIFDDVSASPTDSYYETYSDDFSFFLNNEVYYLIKKENCCCELISKCMKYSRSFWHSLCTISMVSIENFDKNLTEKNITEICLHTELMMVEAFDGEAYIFWEKHDANKGKGFFSDLFLIDKSS